MGSPQDDIRTEFKQESSSDRDFGPKLLLRILGAILVLDLVSLLLGSAFIVMVHGVYYAFLLSLVTQPTRAPALKVLSVISGVLVSEMPPLPAGMPKWRTSWFWFLLRLVVLVAIFSFGIWLLVDEGFSGQNLFLG